MKKFINILLMGLVVLGLGYYMAGSYLKDKNTPMAQDFNRYNLLAKRSPKFMQIDYADADKEQDGSYTFYADAYDRQGNWHEIDLHSTDDFDDGELIKLDTKGSYVKNYSVIHPNDLPYKLYRLFIN